MDQMKANKGGIIDERYAVLIMREVLVALSFLHRANVIHRDLKGEPASDWERTGVKPSM